MGMKIENVPEFKKGNIISLNLTNFQTYSQAFFEFHPNINFIAGSNGTGKSSIANAIFLVFGGTPKGIGKTRDLCEYVKLGETNCSIEVKVKTERSVLTIKRSFTSTNNSSIWFLNNRITHSKQIKEKLNECNIHINNLCNFLPQEKVAEFARYSPKDLFKVLLDVLEDQENKDLKSKIERIEFEKANISSQHTRKEDERKNIENFLENMKKDVQKIKEK